MLVIAPYEKMNGPNANLAGAKTRKNAFNFLTLRKSEYTSYSLTELIVAVRIRFQASPTETKQSPIFNDTFQCPFE